MIIQNGITFNAAACHALGKEEFMRIHKQAGIGCNLEHAWQQIEGKINGGDKEELMNDQDVNNGNLSKPSRPNKKRPKTQS